MYLNTIYGRYYPIQSKIHSMNSSAKILCVLLFLIMITICPQWILVLLTVLILLMTNIPLIVYFKTIKMLIPIYLLLFLLRIFCSIPVILIIIKITLLLFHIVMLSFTTPSMEIIYGLEHVLPILKIKRKNGLSLAYRVVRIFQIVPNVIDERNRILKSKLCRRDQKHVNLYSSFKLILCSLITKRKYFDSIMIVRLYNHHRTNFRKSRWGIFDSYIVMIYVFILLFIIKKGIIR